jgi:uncharacterized membrane protein
VVKSPIVEICSELASKKKLDVRVYITRYWPLLGAANDPKKIARKLYFEFGMHESPQQNSVLLFIHERERRFAWAYGSAWKAKFPPVFWKNLSSVFEEELISTHFDSAVVFTLRTLGESWNS